MGTLKVTFKAAALPPDCRPSRPRSGACAAPLPPWHPHEVIMLGGYVEERPTKGGGGPSAPPSTSPSPPPSRAPTLEAWTFSSAEGGRWHPVPYAEGSRLPQPRLTSQAAVVGDELWLVGGWDPAAGPDAAPFLNDVWALDLRTYRWRQVDVEGEEMPRISRFALAPLSDGRLLLHTHRCDDHVLLLDPRVDPGAAPGAGGGGEAAPGGARALLSKVPTRGADPGAPSPSSRGLHSLTAAAQPHQSPAGQGGAMYVYGGAPQSGPMYGDLWVLDVAAMTWRQLEPQGTQPQPRCSHVAAACSGGGGGGGGGGDSDLPGRYLLVVGGAFYVEPGRLQPLDDVVVYDTQTNRWMEADVEGPRPSPRNAAIMAPLRGAGDSFVLHGGWWPFKESYDDTYIVTVSRAGSAGA